MDQEGRREGYLKYSPLPAIANQHVFDAALTCLKTFELVRADGTKVVIGFSRSVVKKFNTSTGAWDTIGSGYSSAGKKWQVLAINGTLVANNAVDLPFYYNVGDAAVTPMYELREVGVASVGRILEASGFLLIIDITEIFAEVLPLFMRGWSTFTVGSSTAKVANFTVVNGDVGKRFDVTTGASTITATLPSAPPTDFYIWLKKSDAGAGTVRTSPVIAVSPVAMATINDLALVFWDATAENWVSVTLPSGVVPADATYGAPPPYITQRLPWAVGTGEYGSPTQWAPEFAVLMPAASATITLPFASSIFIAGQTRVAVINGGPLGGTLGGQEDSPNGILVTAVAGRTLTLETSTDVDLTYPRVVGILRWTDVSSLVGRYLLQGDNSAITTAYTLRNWIVLFRETGIYLGRYTGDPGAPFVFTAQYSGSNVPLWADCVADIRGDYLLYPAKGNRMYQYDGTTWPTIHETTDAAASLFFSGNDQADECFACECPMTKEWFFLLPATTLCYDYAQDTLSIFDQAFASASVIHKPLTTDFWMILSIGRFIYTYGLVYGITPIQTFLRDGAAVEGNLKWGLNSFGDQANEKTLISYTPLFASQSPDSAVEVQLYSAWNPNAMLATLLTPPESLPTPAGRNFIATIFQAIYIQDQLTIVDTDDADCRVTGRILEVELVRAAGITRSIN